MSTQFHTPPKVSRKQVNKAGKTLLQSSDDTPEFKDAIEIANQWRLAHLYPINTFQSRLRGIVRFMPGAIIAQRLKRMPTIIDKLNRHPSMQLSTMQDIGGVRAIVRDISAVKKVVDNYETSKRFTHELKDKRDYIAEPKPDGYRGVHMIYRYNNTLARNSEAEKYKGLLIEVQVRTIEQHIWSTAVETMGTLLRQPFKTRGGNSEWSEFFALMSSAIAMVERRPVLKQHQDMRPYEIYKAIADKARRLRALELMTGYGYATKIAHDKTLSHYNIIELDIPSRTVNIWSYSKANYKKASTDYARIEQSTKGDITKDVVLVSAGELRTLKKAYPNYFLDLDRFAERLVTIIESVEELE